MFRTPSETALLFIALSLICFAPLLVAQTPKANPNPATTTALTADQAITLAQQGRCKEAIPALKRAMSTSQSPAEIRKSAGVLGLRCSLTLDNRDSATDFIRLLSKQFPRDPDVLFILVHAYSDLSTRTAQDLGRTAPQSIPAHKLNAEALEMQGKWDEAEHEYQTMIEKEPNALGLHYLLGRSLLSRPGVNDQVIERAKQAFQKELEIDPKNAGAHYVLGELAAKAENWDEAIRQFSEAAKLDPNFVEAYLGWGFALISVNRYQEAIAPLRTLEQLSPGNPAVHYSLATALARTGQQEEADKELAIYRSLNAVAPQARSDAKPQ